MLQHVNRQVLFVPIQIPDIEALETRSYNIVSAWCQRMIVNYQPNDSLHTFPPDPVKEPLHTGFAYFPILT
jgi:hypothetical protein